MNGTAKSAWEVFILFVIPIGGGIPGGVLLAKHRGIPWPGMMALYFLSDIVLAFVFEPLMLLVIAGGNRSAKMTRVLEIFKTALRRTTLNLGRGLSPLALIGVAFGADPMTGRAAAKASGHGFLTGWALAIAGDMIYFTVLMVSALWLNQIVGDPAWALGIMLLLMFVLPGVIRRIREKSSSCGGMRLKG